MSKPYGYYLDPALDRIRRLTPVQDWLVCTALFTVLAGVFGWMVSLLALGWWLWPNLDEDHQGGSFLGVYLVCVAVWVVPGSIASAFAVRKHAALIRSEERSGDHDRDGAPI